MEEKFAKCECIINEFQNGTIITVENLGKTYSDNVQIVNRIPLDIIEREIFGLLESIPISK